MVVVGSCCRMDMIEFCCVKQKTEDEMRSSDWSADVCSSDLLAAARRAEQGVGAAVLPDVVDLLQREVGVALRPVEIGVGERVERDPRHASSPLRVTGGRRTQEVVPVEEEEAGGVEGDQGALADLDAVGAMGERPPRAAGVLHQSGKGEGGG